LDGIFIGYENELGEFVDLTIEQDTITDVVVPQNLAQVPRPAHEDCNYDDYETEALCIEKPLELCDVLEITVHHDIPFCDAEHTKEHSFIGDIRDFSLGECVDEERETIVFPVIPNENKTPNNIVSYIPLPEEVRQVDWHACFDAIKASWEKEPEVIEAPELETLMDTVVLPLVQWEAKPHPSPVTSIYATDHVEEVFFSGVESESEVEYSIPEVSDDSILEVIEDPQDWMTEYEREKMESPSLEMMMSMMMIGDSVVRDNFEDICAPLEVVTGETPSVGMLEDEIVLYDIPPDILVEITLLEPIYVCGYHFVEGYAGYFDSPPGIRPPRKKIRRIGDEYGMRMMKTLSVGTYRRERLLEYLLGVIFRPSRFKCWWIELREVHDRCLSINGVYLYMLVGVSLRVEAVPRRIKERPPY